MATPTFDDAGKLIALEASIGSDTYSFEFDTGGSYIHFFGRLADSSSGKRPARSWCWVEYAGAMLTPEILDLIMQRSASREVVDGLRLCESTPMECGYCASVRVCLPRRLVEMTMRHPLRTVSYG